MPPGLMYDTKEGGEVGGGGASFSPASLSTQSLRRGLDKCQCINYRSSAYRMCFVDQKNEKEEAGDGANFPFLSLPTNNALSINFRPRSDAEILLLSTDWGIQIRVKRAETCVQCVHLPTEFPFLHAAVGGWAYFFVCVFSAPYS